MPRGSGSRTTSELPQGPGASCRAAGLESLVALGKSLHLWFLSTLWSAWLQDSKAMHSSAQCLPQPLHKPTCTAHYKNKSTSLALSCLSCLSQIWWKHGNKQCIRPENHCSVSSEILSRKDTK